MWYLLIMLNASYPGADNGGISSQLVQVGPKTECVERMKELDRSKMVFTDTRNVEVRAICIKGK